MIKRFLIAAIIVGLFLGGVGYFNLVFKPKMISDFVSKMVPPPATVTAEAAKTESWIDRVSAIGTLAAVEGVDVAPQLGGMVTDYFFDSGHNVQKGAKLVKLDTSVEEADLADKKAILAQAILDYERQSKLVKTSAVSQATLDQTIAKRDSAAASVQHVDAIIAQKTILAPFAGRLGLRHVEKGQYVSAGQALVSLQALDPIWVDFPVPETSVGKFQVGSTIELTADAYPGQSFKGEVEAFDAKLSSDARMLMVRATVPNPDRKLLPGMFANVGVLAGGAKEFVTVPRTAVTYGLYGDSVWVVKEGALEPAAPPAPTASTEPVASAVAADAAPTGSVPAEPKLTVERRFVRVGPTEGDRVAILEGVKMGEQVVTSGQLKLQPGATVKVDNSGALKPPAELPKQ
ncbi:MAG TPA: efflux RND transporter periplasmic adaptor subunit [Methyloceanibacter sp.]|jgi:membrane fusion protein (multidrug efflux system)|nr:efflux RND transporter periplasmic adaptor subunit [Methyloceanibacter sp.]